jgi:hypothetical protein
VFGKATRYFQRSDHVYTRFVNYTFETYDLTKELTAMLLKDKNLMEGLEFAVTMPEKEHNT